MPGAAVGGRCRLGLADRCAKKFSLQPPTVEGGEVACSKSLSGQRGRNGKRGPSCGARRGHRQALPPRPCRPLRQKVFVAAANGGGRGGGLLQVAFRAAWPERKARPLLRCPARPSAGAAASALPTAAPKNPPCIRRRRRSDFLPMLPALGFKSRQTKRKAPHFRAGLFLAEKEGFEPSRRFPDLRP